MSQPKTIVLACMLYCALLHLAPKKGGLDECETLILSDFRAQCRKEYQQRGSWGVLALWLTTLMPTVYDIGSEQLDTVKLFFARLSPVRISKRQFNRIVISLIIVGISAIVTINIITISGNNINSNWIRSTVPIASLPLLIIRVIRMLRRKSVKLNGVTK